MRNQLDDQPRAFFKEHRVPPPLKRTLDRLVKRRWEFRSPVGASVILGSVDGKQKAHDG